MKIVYYKGIGNNPASVDREKGVMYINRPVFERYDGLTQKFIMYHEEGHYVLGTTDEFEADKYAFDKILSEDPNTTLRGLVETLEKSLSMVSAQDKQRLKLQLSRALFVDWNKFNNIAAKDSLKEINSMTYTSFGRVFIPQNPPLAVNVNISHYAEEDFRDYPEILEQIQRGNVSNDTDLYNLFPHYSEMFDSIGMSSEIPEDVPVTELQPDNVQVTVTQPDSTTVNIQVGKSKFESNTVTEPTNTATQTAPTEAPTADEMLNNADDRPEKRILGMKPKTFWIAAVTAVVVIGLIWYFASGKKAIRVGDIS